MRDRWGRVLVGCCALAGTWVLAYWTWSPRAPRVTFDDGSLAPPSPVRSTLSPAAVEVTRPPEARKPEFVPPQRAASAAPKAQLPVSVPARARSYIVKPGDTLASIAAREVGSEGYAEVIARANPLRDLTKLRAGQVLRLPQDASPGDAKPGKPQPQPIVVPAKGPSENPAGARGDAAPQRNDDRGASAEEYIVKPGDTLSSIAQARYGTPTQASLIAKFNTLSNPNALRVGQRLRLPPKGE